MRSMTTKYYGKKPIAKSVALLVWLLLLCGLSQAQEKDERTGDKNTGLVYGQDHFLVVTAPKGWVLDNQSGVGQGLHAVFYPVGSSWKDGAVVMYVNIYRKQNVAEETLQTVIAGDINEFKKKSEKLKVVAGADLLTRKGKKATVRYFDGDTFGNSEAVAYLDEGKVVVMLIMSARTKKEFEAALPAFAQLAGSYQFLGDKVIQQ